MLNIINLSIYGVYFLTILALFSVGAFVLKEVGEIGQVLKMVVLAVLYTLGISLAFLFPRLEKWIEGQLNKGKVKGVKRSTERK